MSVTDDKIAARDRRIDEEVVLPAAADPRDTDAQRRARNWAVLTAAGGRPASIHRCYFEDGLCVGCGATAP